MKNSINNELAYNRSILVVLPSKEAIMKLEDSMVELYSLKSKSCVGETIKYLTLLRILERIGGSIDSDYNIDKVDIDLKLNNYINQIYSDLNELEENLSKLEDINLDAIHIINTSNMVRDISSFIESFPKPNYLIPSLMPYNYVLQQEMKLVGTLIRSSISNKNPNTEVNYILVVVILLNQLNSKLNHVTTGYLEIDYLNHCDIILHEFGNVHSKSKDGFISLVDDILTDDVWLVSIKIVKFS
jgi:hypothetical protein